MLYIVYQKRKNTSIVLGKLQNILPRIQIFSSFSNGFQVILFSYTNSYIFGDMTHHIVTRKYERNGREKTKCQSIFLSLRVLQKSSQV